MIVLKIIGIILLVFFLLTLLSVKVIASYKDEVLEVKAGYAFLRFTLYPEKEKKEKNPKKQRKKKFPKKSTSPSVFVEKPPPTKDSPTVDSSAPAPPLTQSTEEPPPQQPISPPQKEKSSDDQKKKTSPKDLVEKAKMILPLIKLSKKALLLLKNHLIFDKLYADLSVGGDDAHQTALRYSNHIGALTGGVALLAEAFTVRLKKIIITPDFLSEKSTYIIEARARIRVIWVIIAALRILFVLLRQPGLKLNFRKGGNGYESRKTN